ncbi:Mannose-6-phosphate isomerase [uncultured archaeon]|nr:Mannose-6-phosphate isomerase [uncultured archaeon]
MKTNAQNAGNGPKAKRARHSKKHPEPKTDVRPWGKFEEYATNRKVTVKIITVKKGGVLSLQSHKNREEHWVCLDNGLTAIIGNRKIPLRKGQLVIVPKGAKHRMIAKREARFLEISLGHFDENDIVRYEDRYGRAK